jgi:hypothetical protein
MYSKLLRENSMLGFPGVLSLHSRNTTDADRLGVFMESLRQAFERKLGELCKASQWPEFDRRFGIALKKWSESESHLFYEVCCDVLAVATTALASPDSRCAVTVVAEKFPGHWPAALAAHPEE